MGDNLKILILPDFYNSQKIPKTPKVQPPYIEAVCGGVDCRLTPWRGRAGGRSENPRG